MMCIKKILSGVYAVWMKKCVYIFGMCVIICIGGYSRIANLPNYKNGICFTHSAIGSSRVVYFYLTNVKIKVSNASKKIPKVNNSDRRYDKAFFPFFIGHSP